MKKTNRIFLLFFSTVLSATLIQSAGARTTGTDREQDQLENHALPMEFTQFQMPLEYTTQTVTQTADTIRSQIEVLEIAASGCVHRVTVSNSGMDVDQFVFKITDGLDCESTSGVVAKSVTLPDFSRPKFREIQIPIVGTQRLPTGEFEMRTDRVRSDIPPVAHIQFSILPEEASLFSVSLPPNLKFSILSVQDDGKLLLKLDENKVSHAFLKEIQNAVTAGYRSQRSSAKIVDEGFLTTPLMQGIEVFLNGTQSKIRSTLLDSIVKNRIDTLAQDTSSLITRALANEGVLFNAPGLASMHPEGFVLERTEERLWILDRAE